MKLKLQRKTAQGIINLVKVTIETRPAFPLSGRGYKAHITYSGQKDCPILKWIRSLQLDKNKLYPHFDFVNNRHKSEGTQTRISPELFEIVDSNRWFFDAVRIVFGD